MPRILRSSKKQVADSRSHPTFQVLCNNNRVSFVRLAPAYFLRNSQDFNKILQTVIKREHCFKSSFQRFSSNINSSTDFCNSLHNQLTRPPKQTKVLNTKYFFESPSENLKLSCEILIVEIQPEKMSLAKGKGHHELHFCQLQTI